MSTQVFVLELPIKDSDDVVRFLNRKFDFALSLYNATLHTALGRLERMRNSREWREAILLPKGKERSRKLAEIRFSFGLTEFSLGKVTNDHRNGAKRFVRKTDPGAKRLKNECILGVEVAEAIGSRVWRSVERYLFGKGGRPRFKSRRRGLHSLENKSNHANIIWHPKEKAFAWNRRRIPVEISSSDYIREALSDPLDPSKPRKFKYCRVCRRRIRGRRRYFLQLILEGHPPVRYIPGPKEKWVGIDPGPAKIACVAEDGVFLIPSSPASLNDHSNEKRRLAQLMHRSLKATNPDSFDASGAIKKGATWNCSNRFKKLVNQRNETFRIETAARKTDHRRIANIIIQMGGTIKCEKNSYQSFQENFGKSVRKHGTGDLIQCLRRKAESADNADFIELNAYRCRLSQFNHVDGSYIKKSLKQRWTRIGNTVVQRDAYSAFLAMCVIENRHDPRLLREKWPSVETLLRRAGLARDYNPAKDFDLSRSAIEPVFAAAFRQSGMHARIICAFGDSRSESVLGHPRRTNRKQIK